MAVPTQPTPTSGPAGPTVPASGLGHELIAQLRSELRKTYSTRLWWVLLIPAALLSLAASQGAGALAFTSSLGMALALGWFCSKLAVVYGLVCAAGEFRHRTITTSYLAAPRRWLVTAAKALVAALVGAVYAVASALAGVLGVVFAGGLPDIELDTLLAVCGAAVLTFGLWAVLGVGMGTLLNNELAAIVAVLLYLWPGEKIVSVIASLTGLGQIEDYLPGGAADAVLTDLANASSLGGGSSGTLPWWLALLIFAGYAAVAVLAGAAAAQRRDIT
ncbi:MAG: hypothetical protein H0V92_02320 [Pseudonocardiales bacterium]|nr:hypothetical protein [Pseudonocardiales bacterium]